MPPDPPHRPQRIESIDRLRGLVMLLMLVDHAREFFFIGHQVADPMDLAATSPALFLTRLAAHLCAPVFVALTGLAAWLYGQQRSTADTAAFLLKRGAFLIVLEVTLVGFAWSFALPPTTIYLQVIFAIGMSMVALAALVYLPRAAVAAIGVGIVAGHNLLDPVSLPPGGAGHAVWAVLHDRGYIALGDGLRARTSYPVLPWIGVIALGYTVGPWFVLERGARRRRLAIAGVAMLGAFVALRALNLYGDPVPWGAEGGMGQTAMAFVNLTKYPPSLDFLLLTLGIGALLLAAWDAQPGGALAVMGGAPLFFYLLHLDVLHLAKVAWVALAGGEGEVPSVAWVWLIAAVAAPPVWWATRWFAQVKPRRHRGWLRYL